MRAALGLALVAGGALLVLMALHGRTPFDASTSASGGRASQTPASGGGVDLITAPANRFGGTP